MKTAAILLLVAALAGCESVPTVTVPREVNVPVLAPCIDPADAPQAPAVPSEAELLAMDPYRRTIAVWVAYVELQIYKLKAAAMVQQCSQIPAPKLRVDRESQGAS